MTHLPLKNPNRFVSSRQSIGIRACHVYPDCRSIDYFGRLIDNALDQISWSINQHRCLSPCAPFKSLILQRCCHVNPNTCALNGSNDFFSCFFASPTENTAFYFKVLQNTKTPKLTKKSENNKAKGLTNAN